MTGQEALDFSLAQCNTSQQALDTNTDAYAAWALRTVNFACADLYYFIQARLASSDRETGVSTHDFEPFNAAEYPDGSPDVLLLQPEQEIVRLYAKYTADGIPCKRHSYHSTLFRSHRSITLGRPRKQHHSI